MEVHSIILILGRCNRSCALYQKYARFERMHVLGTLYMHICKHYVGKLYWKPSKPPKHGIICHKPYNKEWQAHNSWTNSKLSNKYSTRAHSLYNNKTWLKGGIYMRFKTSFNIHVCIQFPPIQAKYTSNSWWERVYKTFLTIQNDESLLSTVTFPLSI